MPTLAKVNHTGFALAVGIVENILKSQRISGVGVLVIIFLVDEFDIIACSICHHNNICFVGYAAIWACLARSFCPTSGCYSCRMCAVRLRKTV